MTLAAAGDYRVRVRKRDGAWRAALVGAELESPIIVGEFDTMPDAVTRGITALRFVGAGIPWRAE